MRVSFPSASDGFSMQAICGFWQICQTHGIPQCSFQAEKPVFGKKPFALYQVLDTSKILSL
jgi:hypothetical protein